MSVTFTKRGYINSLTDDDLIKLILSLSLQKNNTERTLIKAALQELESRHKDGDCPDEKK